MLPHDSSSFEPEAELEEVEVEGAAGYTYTCCRDGKRVVKI
jgi:hypothetical protein